VNNPLQILLVQLYANGDCLYATAIARQVKQDYPGCKLTWAIARSCSAIIAQNPYVDEARIVDDVAKNDVKAFRSLRRKLMAEKKQGRWDEVFITHNMERNLALYDGTVRGMIIRAYPNPVTVSLQPVLVLTPEEEQRVKVFADQHHLHDFRNVILWEYAPQSGQSLLNFDLVKATAEKLVAQPGTCVILTSANAFNGNNKIIDASVLTVRENAALTHYCSLLIGCSSGITWLSTSSAAKQLPMLQLLDGQAYFRNAPSDDFARYGFPVNELVELHEFDEQKITDTVKEIIDNGIAAAKQKHDQPLPVQFNSTRKIVYNLLCYLQFGAVYKHYRITTDIYGRHPLFIREFLVTILAFPFRLLANKWRKSRR
jgi:hypothetical protein